MPAPRKVSGAEQICLLYFFPISKISLHSFELIPNGFSEYTCFEDLIDSIVIFLCSFGGVKFKMVSISGFSNISSKDLTKEIEYLEL